MPTYDVDLDPGVERLQSKETWTGFKRHIERVVWAAAGLDSASFPVLLPLLSATLRFSGMDTCKEVMCKGSVTAPIDGE